ncbi:DNA methyltransferase [Modicisalibacter coralii]|uniref:DNA methyltransferase n=1 Tax=Modicisalibacter coralii TaxID=2304602 RepID=UPI00100A40F9|nr:DNA methyltransferase [Halomonas coralii]
MDYQQFLEAKVPPAPVFGAPVATADLNPVLKDHHRAMVQWLVDGGRRGCFASFGLGKSVIQLETVRICRERAGGMVLIVIPLGVRQEFIRDAWMLRTGDHPHITDDQRQQLGAWLGDEPERRAPVPKFIRRIEEAKDPEGIYLTNYETVRDGKLDPRAFSVASLDEASCLRGFGGTKTFREFMALFAGDDRQTGVKRPGIPYRFVATATPSPNDYIELLAYAAFLGIMDVGQAKTRFFRRNSEKADKLTIHPHKEREFWLWVASWALFVQRPSDLGFSDEGYELPELDIRWHEIPSDHSEAGSEKDGQGRLFANAAIGVVDAAREKRHSLEARVAKLMDLRAEDPGAHRLIWHDLEAERHAIEKAIPGITSVYGSQDLDEREAAIIDFSEGRYPELAAKPSIAGSGCNFQRFCWWAVFLGIGFKFNDFIQAIHRLQRFQQTHQVRIDLIYTEAEIQVQQELQRKWRQHEHQVETMSKIIREFGLTQHALNDQLARSLGIERVEASGDGYTVVNNDCVLETRAMAENSIDLIVTSIPFSTQYEYSPSYNDFGHTDDNAHFWAQMDYLVPELLRVLKPGRVAAIHVKDRIVPGGINGLGFQTVHPFSDETIANFIKHGFALLARKTIVTDVVRENNQTYRLGWTEQCKDGSRMGNGTPEYLLVFRKPPSDPSNGYADEPVVKDKAEYSRARWQMDAHGFMRSSGDRLLNPAELEGMDQAAIFQLFKRHSLEEVYDFRHDVKIAEAVDETGWLPTTFMLLQPQSWHPDVWADVVRMRSLNTSQASKGKEQHLCPLPFDIVERCIEQYSMKGEEVFDPFGGLMTVPYCAIKAGRRGRGCELSPAYFMDGAGYCAAAAKEMSMPSLFDALEEEENAA